MIRAVPANAFDRHLCNELAWNATKGLSLGFRAHTVGFVSNQVVLIPAKQIINAQEGTGAKPGQRTIDLSTSPMWEQFKNRTAQPDFK